MMACFRPASTCLARWTFSLTGVTFPFVSNGGTATITSGLLAFLKATDTRQNASFAIRPALPAE